MKKNAIIFTLLLSLIISYSCNITKREGQQFTSKVRALTKELVSKLREKDIILVIYNFRDENNKITPFSSIIADEFSVAFVDNGIPVVEKNRLSEILKEFRDQEETGLYSEKTIARIGEMTGANHALIGSYNKYGNEYTLNLKVVKLTKGISVSTAKGYFLEDEIPKGKVDTLLEGNYTTNFRLKDNKCNINYLDIKNNPLWTFSSQGGQIILNTDNFKGVKLLYSNGKYKGSTVNIIKQDKDNILFRLFMSVEKCIIKDDIDFIFTSSSNRFEGQIIHNYSDISSDEFQYSTCKETFSKEIPCQSTIDVFGTQEDSVIIKKP